MHHILQYMAEIKKNHTDHCPRPIACGGMGDGFNPAALEFLPGLPMAVVERSWCNTAYVLRVGGSAAHDTPREPA